MAKAENGKIHNGDTLAIARQVLDKQWKDCFITGFHGRTWGTKKNPDNPFYGSNIDFSNGNEIVILSEDKAGNIRTHGFSKNGETVLFDGICSTLRENNLLK
jgi:hypothetical protein